MILPITLKVVSEITSSKASANSHSSLSQRASSSINSKLLVSISTKMCWFPSWPHLKCICRLTKSLVASTCTATLSLWPKQLLLTPTRTSSCISHRWSQLPTSGESTRDYFSFFCLMNPSPKRTEISLCLETRPLSEKVYSFCCKLMESLTKSKTIRGILR